MNPTAEPARASELTAEILHSPLLADLGLRLVAGESGFGRPISWGRIQRPGLALAGFTAFIKPGRIQILGESELHYLETMPAELRAQRIASICALPVAAFVVTKGQQVPEDLARECRLQSVPLLVSDQTTSVVIQSITRVLEDELAPSTMLHGVLVDVYGMGVLLIGDSGIGKSECALDLIQRGHRLVADDAVQIRKYPNGSLVGRAADRFDHGEAAGHEQRQGQRASRARIVAGQRVRMRITVIVSAAGVMVVRVGHRMVCRHAGKFAHCARGQRGRKFKSRYITRHALHPAR